MAYEGLISRDYAVVYLTRAGTFRCDVCAPTIRAENARIAFFVIFDPAEILAAQKPLGRNEHMHVRP